MGVQLSYAQTPDCVAKLGQPATLLCSVGEHKDTEGEKN